MIAYIRKRLNERSFYLMVGAGITAASALAHPWGVFSLVVAVIAALVPDGPMKK